MTENLKDNCNVPFLLAGGNPQWKPKSVQSQEKHLKMVLPPDSSDPLEIDVASLPKKRRVRTVQPAPASAERVECPMSQYEKWLAGETGLSINTVDNEDFDG